MQSDGSATSAEYVRRVALPQRLGPEIPSIGMSVGSPKGSIVLVLFCPKSGTDLRREPDAIRYSSHIPASC
jgi:hypothetical protein